MKRVASFLIGVLVSLGASASVAHELSGYWQHEDQPAWIEVRFDGGVGIGTVVRNDLYPDRVGRVLLKDIEQDGNGKNQWRGQVYAEKFEDYRKAEFSLPDPDQLRIKVKVGFMSRTLNWQRVSELPVKTAESAGM